MKKQYLISGEAGTGKSLGCASFSMDGRVLYLDVENKNKDLIEKKYPDSGITWIGLLKFDNEFQADWLKTMDALELEINAIKQKCREFRSGKITDIGYDWIVIDGISPIRKECMKSRWLRDHKGRKNPMEKEWAEINDATKEFLFGVSNLAVCDFVNVVFTAEFEDEYAKVEQWDEKSQTYKLVSAKVGRKPAFKDWIGFKMSNLIELYSDPIKGTRKAVCPKSQMSGMWTADIKDKSLYEVILENEL